MGVERKCVVCGRKLATRHPLYKLCSNACRREKKRRDEWARTGRRKPECVVCGQSFKPNRNQIACGPECQRTRQLRMAIAYRSRPEIRDHRRELAREYQRRRARIPEIKTRLEAYRKMYCARAEVKARKRVKARLYCSRPEVKARVAEYRKRAEILERSKKYNTWYKRKNSAMKAIVQLSVTAAALAKKDCR